MKSPNKTALVAGVSARALAQAARRAGYRVLAADFFEDLDTVAACIRTARLPGSLRDGVDKVATLSTLMALAEGETIDCLVLGSGFERLPELVDTLAAHYPLAGNEGDAIRRIKHPETLATDCKALGIPHPALQREPPRDPDNWLMKTEGAAGGAHVQRAGTQARPAGTYYQQRLSGTSISALFLGTQNGAEIVGFSRQWQSPSPGAPYRYGGAVCLTRFRRSDAETLTRWLNTLCRRTNLFGLCSADFIRTISGHFLLEINPRPGATLDIFDNDDAKLFGAHVKACRGEPFSLTRRAGSTASMIAYAERELESLPAFHWPDWTADHQASGSRLAQGDPICSIFAYGESASAARRNLKINERMLAENWLRHGS